MKNRKNPKVKPTRQRNKKRKAGALVVRPMLDSPALKWANLLKNPRLGELTRPIYNGMGGQLFRGTSTVMFAGNGTTENAGNFVLVPAVAPGSITSNKVAGSIIATPTFYIGGPGATFISNNATTYRAVAAMMEVTYLGSELNRSGTLSFGILPANEVVPGNPINLDVLSTFVPHTDRVDDSTHSMRWFPGSTDHEYRAAGDLSFSAGTNAIVMVVQNMLPAAFSFRVEMTVVYEYTLNRTTGQTQELTAHHGSQNTAEHVVQALHKSGTWLKAIGDSGHAAYNFAEGAARAIHGVGHAFQGMRGLGRVAQYALKGAERAAPMLTLL